MRTSTDMTRVGHVGLGVFAAVLSWVPVRAVAEEELRIALVAGAEKVSIAGVELTLFDGESGEKLFGWPSVHECQVRVGSDGRLAVDGAASIEPSHPTRPTAKPAARPTARPTAKPTAEPVTRPTRKPNPRRLLVEAKDGIRVAGGLYLGRLEIVPDAKSRLLVINRLPLETYLLGIIGNEMNSNWPIEALKAQAVAARTYAMQRRMMTRAAHKPYDLEATVLSQVYKGAEKISPSVIRAVSETRGEVMSHRHDLVEALFHSTCGGHTVAAESEFGRQIPYLVSRPCPWCRESTRHRWRTTIPLEEISAKLKGAHVTSAGVKRLDRASMTKDVVVSAGWKEKLVPARDLRAAIGYSNLYSSRFIAETTGERVKFEGQGFGHGVGMCQWGARGMALAGFRYREILVQYYAGVELRRLY